MTDHKTIQYSVMIAMRDYPEFREHKNRTKLFLYLYNRGEATSMESVFRAQRKLWSENIGLPEDQVTLQEFKRIRRNKVKEYIGEYCDK